MNLVSNTSKIRYFLIHYYNLYSLHKNKRFFLFYFLIQTSGQLKFCVKLSKKLFLFSQESKAWERSKRQQYFVGESDKTN